jgi:hypothetical protein
MPATKPSDLVPLATRVTEQLRREVKSRAALEGRAVQDLIAQALIEYLSNHAESGPAP